MKMKTRTLAALTLLLVAAVHAQGGAIQRSTLQDLPFPGPAYHTVTTKAVVPQGSRVPPHTHPGIEMAYIAAGSAELSVEGQPARALHAGDSFAIPKGTVHSVRNVGTDDLVLISTYVVDKAAPLVQPIK
jgi:quercetin dioxygenase-like cupin family protein